MGQDRSEWTLALMLEQRTGLDLPFKLLDGGKIKDPERGQCSWGTGDMGGQWELGAVATYQEI